MCLVFTAPTSRPMSFIASNKVSRFFLDNRTSKKCKSYISLGCDVLYFVRYVPTCWGKWDTQIFRIDGTILNLILSRWRLLRHAHRVYVSHLPLLLLESRVIDTKTHIRNTTFRNHKMPKRPVRRAIAVDGIVVKPSKGLNNSWLKNLSFSSSDM